MKIISKEKLQKYIAMTEEALKIASTSINPKKKRNAEEILNMVSCYVSDAKHFFGKGNYVNSFACINYAHGWLDCGCRMKIFNVSDSNLFSV